MLNAYKGVQKLLHNFTAETPPAWNLSLDLRSP